MAKEDLFEVQSNGDGDGERPPGTNGDRPDPVDPEIEHGEPEDFGLPPNVGFSWRLRVFVFFFAFFALLWSAINALLVAGYLVLNIVSLFRWQLGQIQLYRFAGAVSRWFQVGVAALIFAFIPAWGLAYLLRVFVRQAEQVHRNVILNYLRSNYRDR